MCPHAESSILTALISTFEMFAFNPVLPPKRPIFEQTVSDHGIRSMSNPFTPRFTPRSP